MVKKEKKFDISIKLKIKQYFVEKFVLIYLKKNTFQMK